MKKPKKIKLCRKDAENAIAFWAKVAYDKADKRTIKVTFEQGLFGSYAQVTYKEKD
jgi:hypothetical protein